MGSLGSLTINNIMMDIVPKFDKKEYEVLLVTGKNYFDNYKSVSIPTNVKVVPFIEEMLSVLKKTDLIVTRAGASTIAEITALGIPSIMVPSPYVTHNHQEKNALVLEEKVIDAVKQKSQVLPTRLPGSGPALPLSAPRPSRQMIQPHSRVPSSPVPQCICAYFVFYWETLVITTPTPQKNTQQTWIIFSASQITLSLHSHPTRTSFTS